MSYIVVTMKSNGALYHHGIKGREWGVKNGPPYPLDDEDHNAAERKAGWKSSLSGGTRETVAEKKTAYKNAKNFHKTRKTKQSRNDLDWAKKEYKDEKAKFKINQENKISKHRQKLIDKYREKGMSEEEAQVAAYRRAKMEKALVVAGVITITAAAAYVAKRHYDYKVDKVLKSGAELKRVTPDDSTKLHDLYYAALAKNKGDVARYEGMYGGIQMRKMGGAKNVYQKTIRLGNDAKIVSHDNARKILGDLANKDQEYRQGVERAARYAKMYMPNAKQQALADRALKDISMGKYNTKSVYEVTNLTVPLMNEGAINDTLLNNTRSKFISTLKKAGYDGILDLNDKKYSGYQAKAPVIMFKNASQSVANVRKLSDREMDLKGLEAVARIGGRSLAKTSAGVGGIIGVKKAIDRNNTSKANDAFVKRYRNEHPNTELSYNEILKMNKKKPTN